MVDVDRLTAYEHGALGAASTLALFGELIASGLAWSLQGAYGRTAADLIAAGYLDADGALTPMGEAVTDDTTVEDEED